MPPDFLDLDPSRPCQLGGGFLALWRPRGRGRNDPAFGLLASLRVCANASCACTEATLAAMRIDDRVLRATRGKEGVQLVRREGSKPLDAKVYSLLLDFLDGRVTTTSRGPLPEDVTPFFEEPIPAWILDDLHAQWLKHRSLLEEPWYESALRGWQPGELLSLLTAFPDSREDQFLRDGKRYLVDFAFCIAPGCTCAGNRLVVLQSTASGPKEQVWTEIASAELDEKMVLRHYEGTPEHRATLNALYLDWRARSGHPEARFAELREKVLLRGKELLSRWAARQPGLSSAQPPAPTPASPQMPATTSQGKPGRNEPCPCGSGKKFKKCCGA